MIKVLIVDDSALICNRLIAMLSDFSEIEIVGQAQSSVEATNAIRKQAPDVVILGIRLAGGSGIDVLKSIKENDPVPTVIMLTSYPYPEYRRKCMDAGADFFFNKSADFDKIPETIKQLMKDPHTLLNG